MSEFFFEFFGGHSRAIEEKNSDFTNLRWKIHSVTRKFLLHILTGDNAEDTSPVVILLFT